MLDIKLLNTKVIQYFLEQLYQNVIDRYNLAILQDRQSAPRPTDAAGNIKTYVYYRVDAPHTLQGQTKELVTKSDGTYQATITQKQMHVRINFLGPHAIDAANYFDHAINSVLAYQALRPTVNDTVVELQYNGHTDPTDLTEIEMTKWISRVEYEVLLGYIDREDFKQWTNGIWTFKGESRRKIGHPRPRAAAPDATARRKWEALCDRVLP